MAAGTSQLAHGLGLQPFAHVDAGLQVVQVGDDAALLLEEEWNRQLQGSDIAQIQTWLALTIALSRKLSIARWRKR